MAASRMAAVVAGGMIGVLATLSFAEVSGPVIQVRSAVVRERPLFLSPVVDTLEYGDEVEITSRVRAWAEIRRADGTTGWLHGSALGRAVPTLRAGERDVETGVEQDELALAGKGFNQAVEDTYKARHGDDGFEVVDRMETEGLPDHVLRRFLREGRLQPLPEAGR